MADYQKQFVRLKLEFLEKKTANLHQAVDDYVTEVMSAGKLWIENPKGGSNFRDINALIDSSIKFVDEKCEDLSAPKGQTSSVTLPSTSMEFPQGKNVTGESSPTAAVEVPSTLKVSDDATLRKILTRVEVLEEAVASFRSTTQAVSTNQSHVQSQVEAFDDKQLKLEEEIDGMKARQTELGEQQNQKVSDIEKKVKKVKTRQTEMGKQQDKRLKDIEKQLQTIASKQMEMDQEHSEKLKEMETEQTLAREEMEGVKSQICDLDHKCESFDKRALDMTTKIETNLSSIQELTAKRNKDLKRMKRIEEKIKTVEDNLGKKYDEVNGNFKMVCSIIANRLTPLERLRDIFNRCKKRVEDRETVMGKYNEVLEKLEELSRRTESLETVKVKQPSVGFTAELSVPATVENWEVINSFTLINSNEGNHFNTQSGVFTAPQDGLYMASVTIEQEGDGEIRVAIIHCQSNTGTGRKEKNVCNTRTCTNNTSSCCVGVVRMVGGDQLYVKSWREKGNVKLGVWSSFSCCLVE